MPRYALRARLHASCCVCALALTGLSAAGSDAAAAPTTPTEVAGTPAAPSAETAASAAPPPAATEVQAIVVTADKGRASTVAPVTPSLKETEPEAIITRKFIEEAAPRVGDYTTSAILAPSLATTSNPNGPGSTDGSKLTLRGFQDGEYNTTYDGVAWGDTNGPTHHANSFFPSSTIGGIVVDRGPGDATALGQANFGGSVNLFSLPFEDRPTAIQTGTLGSFGVWQSVTTLASGPIAQLHDANVVANFMEYGTDGYLSHSGSQGQNQFIKVTVPVTSTFRITALYTHNYDQYYQSDASATGTVAQNQAYGKRFALSDDPSLQPYYKYNNTKKKTDFEYLKAEWDAGFGFHITDTLYSYYYNNRTLSANSVADQTLGAAALLTADKVTLKASAAYPASGKGYSATAQVAGLPGYLKRNEYRVTGNIFRLDKDFDFGRFTYGVLYEAANTQRSRFDIDLLTRLPDYREKAAALPGPSGCLGLPVRSDPGKADNGACEEPLNVAYNEYSGWRQYQLFSEFAWKPTDRLTVTPGFKLINFELFVHAPALAISGSIQPSFQDTTYTKPLGFFTANYRVSPNLSAYAQFAQGFLVPNVSAFYVLQPTLKPVVPQESNTSQIGAVYASGRFTVDADVYYIDFKHKIQTITDLTTNETYETNFGGAIYKGAELQGTYALPFGFSVFANGSLNDATGNGDPVNAGYNGKQLAKAPFWTAATGLRFGHSGIFRGDDAVVATLDTKWIGQQYANAASGATPPTALLHSWAETNLSTTYRLGRYALEAQVLNLFDGDAATAFKGKALIAGTNLPANTVAEGGAANVFTYQAGRSVQVTARVAF